MWLFADGEPTERERLLLEELHLRTQLTRSLALALSVVLWAGMIYLWRAELAAFLLGLGGDRV